MEFGGTMSRTCLETIIRREFLQAGLLGLFGGMAFPGVTYGSPARTVMHPGLFARRSIAPRHVGLETECPHRNSRQLQADCDCRAGSSNLRAFAPLGSDGSAVCHRPIGDASQSQSQAHDLLLADGPAHDTSEPRRH